MTKHNYILELVRYLIVYPLYYVIGMFFASLLCKFIVDLTYIETKILFFVLALGMWAFSYVIHFNLFLFSIKGLKSKGSTP